METKQQKARRICDWRKKNPEKAKAIKQRWISKNREKHVNGARNAALQRRYGSTLADYDSMFENQKGACAICGVLSGEGRKRLVVDHCHTSGRVRQLLCQSCNAVIGMSFEDISILQSAVNYLNRHNGGA